MQRNYPGGGIKLRANGGQAVSRSDNCPPHHLWQLVKVAAATNNKLHTSTGSLLLSFSTILFNAYANEAQFPLHRHCCFMHSELSNNVLLLNTKKRYVCACVWKCAGLYWCTCCWRQSCKQMTGVAGSSSSFYYFHAWNGSLHCDLLSGSYNSFPTSIHLYIYT